MTTNYDKPFEQRPGQGGVFRNKNKTQDSQPGYTGKVMLPNGELRFMSIWVKKTKAGEPWLSISVGDIVQQQGQQQGMVLDSAKPFAAPAAPIAKPTPAANAVADMDDDIPF
jgi:hypothetical protein